MQNQQQIQEIISDQLKRIKQPNSAILRNIDYQYLINSPFISVITGIRRSGKSTVLQQLTKNYTNFYYINFDDERLFEFELSDFQKLMLAFKQHFSSKVIFLDEIQNVPNWERFIRRIYDEGYKIFVTGSNAKLLSSELATHLTGRYIKTELYPFSFLEYLQYHKIDYSQKDSDTKSQILKYFNKYRL